MHIGSEIKKVFVIGMLLFSSVFLLAYFGLPFLSGTTYDSTLPSQVIGSTTNASIEKEKSFVVTHVETPKGLKSFYMSACVAATPTWRNRMANLVKTTELNSIIRLTLSGY